MERWLSKSRVMLGLCAVLLIAALNRRDPMVYAMFLFLAVVTVLGFVLPWLSLRAITVRLNAPSELEVLEDEPCKLDMLIQHTALWPAFMVDIETEWVWASHRIVRTQTIPVIRRGRAPDLGQMVRFPCRGRYELVAVHLSSGFPLGLIRAQRTLAQPQIHLRVMPRAQLVHWPIPWDISDDPIGDLTTRRVGQSFELGILRPYQYGEPVGRVSWRASARAGELVIQHFQQSGCIRLRVMVGVPGDNGLGDAEGPGEQAIRLALGVCDAGVEAGAQVFLYLEDLAEPVCGAGSIRRALAGALSQDGLNHVAARVARDAARGEQISVVVTETWSASALEQVLGSLVSQGASVVVCIALGKRRAAGDLARGQALQRALGQAGIATLMEMP